MPTPAEIEQAIAFIEDHLHENIGVGDIADAIGYSLFHFSRTFNAAIHHTPYDYLMRRRLSESASDLLSTDRLIIDIAYDYAFANPETYTRAFKRMFGILPSTCRSKGRLPYLTAMPRFTPAHLAHLTGGHPPRPHLLRLPRLSLVGLTALMANDAIPSSEAVLTLWQFMARDLVEQGSPVASDEMDDFEKPEDLIEVSRTQAWLVTRYMERKEHGQCLYAAAVPAGNPLSLPFTPSLVLPPGRYVRCTLHDGSPQTLSLIRDYIAYTWLPRAGHGILAPLELLAYPTLPAMPDIVPTALYMALN